MKKKIPSFFLPLFVAFPKMFQFVPSHIAMLFTIFVPVAEEAFWNHPVANLHFFEKKKKFFNVQDYIKSYSWVPLKTIELTLKNFRNHKMPKKKEPSFHIRMLAHQMLHQILHSKMHFQVETNFDHPKMQYLNSIHSRLLLRMPLQHICHFFLVFFWKPIHLK